MVLHGEIHIEGLEDPQDRVSPVRAHARVTEHFDVDGVAQREVHLGKAHGNEEGREEGDEEDFEVLLIVFG